MVPGGGIVITRSMIALTCGGIELTCRRNVFTHRQIVLAGGGIPVTGDRVVVSKRRCVGDRVLVGCATPDRTPARAQPGRPGACGRQVPGQRPTRRRGDEPLGDIGQRRALRNLRGF